MLSFFKKSRMAGKENVHLRCLQNWVSENNGVTRTLMYKFYDDGKLCEVPEAIIAVGEFQLHSSERAGFYVEISNESIVLGRLFFPSGIVSWHNSLSMQARMAGVSLFTALCEAEENHRQSFPK